MSESRYKIEYVQQEPLTKKQFRFFGAFGYLWLALLASVLIYGIVFKHIPTSQIVAYFQNIKTEVIETDISSLIQEDNSDKAASPEVSSNNVTKTKTSADNENIEKPEVTQKLVSEIVNDDQLPEDVVFESEQVEPTITQTQQEETDSIVTEIIKEQQKQEKPTELTLVTEVSEQNETIENATSAIEKEIEKTAEAAEEEKPTNQETLPNETVSNEDKQGTSTPESTLNDENVVENTATEEPKEKSAETYVPQIEESKEEIDTKKDIVVEVEEEAPPIVTLSQLVEDASAKPNQKDLAYIKAVSEYESTKIADQSYLDKIKPQTNTTIESEENAKKAEKKEVSAVDAIIAAMNAEKEAKNKPPLSYQEKIQAEVNLLLKK